MIALVLDHLWQSSIFVGAAGLLTLALRRNSANVRFWLWFAASVKFLVPFAALTALGTYFLTTIISPLYAPRVTLIEPLAQPFSSSTPVLAIPGFKSAPAEMHLSLAAILLAIWAIGFAAIAIRWVVRWSRVRKLLRDAADTKIVAPIAVKSSVSRLEPGLVGILRPVILLPQGIEQHLSPPELNAVLTHELCHWQRRDNLLATVHMMVEALFWYFPLVWWLGARLNVERERACDESVLATGNDPGVYAGSILKVCRVYLQSPIACVSGVSGSDLKRRMDTIIENRISIHLNMATKFLLASSATFVVAAPLALGLLVSPKAIAQTPSGEAPRTAPSPGTEAALRHQIEGWENKQPAVEALGAGMVAATRQQQAAIQKSIDDFGALKSIAFNSVDPQGWDVYAVVFENAKTVWSIAPLMPDGKISGMLFGKAIPRDGTNAPSPGTEAALRRDIDGLQIGQPPYDIMMPGLVAATQKQLAGIEQDSKALGALKSLTFKSVNVQGWDVYEAVYDRGHATWTIAPLTDGKMGGVLMTAMHIEAPPHPGTEASLRRYIESLEKGQPNYDEMVPAMADTVRRQLPDILATIKPLGALKSIAFQGGGPMGMDVYYVTFEHGNAEWKVAPLTADGRVERRGFRLLP